MPLVGAVLNNSSSNSIALDLMTRGCTTPHLPPPLLPLTSTSTMAVHPHPTTPTHLNSSSMGMGTLAWVVAVGHGTLPPTLIIITTTTSRDTLLLQTLLPLHQHPGRKRQHNPHPSPR